MISRLGMSSLLNPYKAEASDMRQERWSGWYIMQSRWRSEWKQETSIKFVKCEWYPISNYKQNLDFIMLQLAIFTLHIVHFIHNIDEAALIWKNLWSGKFKKLTLQIWDWRLLSQWKTFDLFHTERFIFERPQRFIWHSREYWIQNESWSSWALVCADVLINYESLRI